MRRAVTGSIQHANTFAEAAALLPMNFKPEGDIVRAGPIEH